MAAIAKVGKPRPCSDVPQSNQFTLPMFVDGAAGDLVYVKADGTFDLASGDAADAASHVFGMLTTDAKAGEPATAVFGVRVAYGAGLTPGSLVYLSPSVLGGIDTANATVTRPVGRALTGGRIQLFDPADRAAV